MVLPSANLPKKALPIDIMRRVVFSFGRKIPQPYLSLSWLAGSPWKFVRFCTNHYGKLARHDMSYSRNPTKSFNDYSLGLFPSRRPFLGSCPANPMTKWSATWMRQVLRSCSAMPSGDLQQQTLGKGLFEMEQMGCLQASLHCISTLNLPLTEWQHTWILQRSCLAHPFRLLVLRYQPWSLSCGGALGARMRWWCRKLGPGGFCPS